MSAARMHDVRKSFLKMGSGIISCSFAIIMPLAEIGNESVFWPLISPSVKTPYTHLKCRETFKMCKWWSVLVAMKVKAMCQEEKKLDKQTKALMMNDTPMKMNVPPTICFSLLQLFLSIVLLGCFVLLFWTRQHHLSPKIVPVDALLPCWDMHACLCEKDC